MTTPSIRILAVASGGGHWGQLQRLKTAFVGHRVIYATVGLCDPTVVAPEEVRLLPDANARTPVRMLWLLVRVAWLVLAISVSGPKGNHEVPKPWWVGGGLLVLVMSGGMLYRIRKRGTRA